MVTQHENLAQHVWAKYRWRTFDPNDLSINDGTLSEAAQALHLDPNEVEWACTEFGRCDAEHAVCWQPGPIQNTPEGESFAGGYEWPAAESPSEDDREQYHEWTERD